MTRRATASLMVSVLAAMIWLYDVPVSQGQGGYKWRLGNEPDGRVTASIFSINMLNAGSSRVIDYHPTLTIACRPGGEPDWSQSVQLKDPVSGSGTVRISVRFDDGGEAIEQWALGFQDRSFSKDGSSGVARLLSSRRLRLSWHFGFLSGRGEAVFDLADIGAAVVGLAGACGVEPPSP